VLVERGAGGRAGGPRPHEVGQRERADVALRRRRGDRHARPGPFEGAAQLGVGGAQPGRRAEGEQEDVGARHARGILAARDILRRAP